jgi:hypothetical protein
MLFGKYDGANVGICEIKWIKRVLLSIGIGA